jgi:hydroxymethylglutaryl-CoA reductase
MSKEVIGFSKWSKSEKINWIAERYFENPTQGIAIIERYWNSDEGVQKLHDEFIENTITNYYLPLGVAPNFMIDGKLLVIPMAIEESSVVAAASKSAKYWLDRGGFKTEIIQTKKSGQVHFTFSGGTDKLTSYFNQIKPILIQSIHDIAANMIKRIKLTITISWMPPSKQLMPWAPTLSTPV